MTAPRLAGMTVVKSLGRGGFAEVFLYEQERPRMRVAVKVMLGEGLSDQAKDRFAAEANAMAELADHPYIVQVFRSDVTEDGRPYMVMKYYPQRNLAVRARAEQIAVPEVLQTGVRIASAVETAHRAGILHRDIKPANILTSQYGEPGLTDFGIATTIGAETSDSDGMSVPWSPPEILFGNSAGDRLSDVYSLGATIWHLLAGHSPFETPGGDNSTVAMMRRIKEEPPPKTGRPDVPSSLERILAQTMAKNPADRPADALQLARNLQAVETEQRWAPTPLVVLTGDLVETEDDPSVPEPEDSDQHTVNRAGPAPESETRLRRPQEVRAQPPIPPAEPVPEIDTDGTRRRAAHPVQTRPPAGRVRQGMPAQVSDRATVRRPVVPSPNSDVAPAEADIEARPTKTRLWAIGGSLVIVVGAALGVILSSNGHHRSDSTTSVSGPAPTIAQAAVNQPTVQPVSVSPTEIQFTWNDPGAESGDTFLYSKNGGPYVSTGTQQSVTLPISAGGSVCVTVEIDRSGPVSSPSAVTCN